MADQTVESSPQVYARVGGGLYLIIIITGLLSEIFVRGKLVVPDDVLVTAHNIATSQLLWRIGIVCDLIAHVCDVPLILILYLLLRPVNKPLALLAVFFTLTQTAVLVATKLNLFAPLLLLGNAEYLKAFEPRQLDALMYLAIRLDSLGFGVGLIFFGFACIVLGYLIYRSIYLPRALGILLQIAGLCYLTNSFALILAPAFAGVIFPGILLPAFVAESSLCLWLLVKGLNVQLWKERALSSV